MSIDLNADLDLEVMHDDQGEQSRGLGIIMANEYFSVELFPKPKLIRHDNEGKDTDHTEGFINMMQGNMHPNIRKAIQDEGIKSVLEDEKNHDVIPHLSNDNIRIAIQDDDIKSVLQEEGKHDKVAKLTDNKLANALGYEDITNLLVKSELKELLDDHAIDDNQVFGITVISKADKTEIDAKLGAGKPLPDNN